MKAYKNFKEYMEDNYYDEIFDAVKGLVFSDKDSFEDEEITSVKWVEAEDIHVEGVTFKECSNGELEIRVTVDTEIEVKGKAGRDYDSFSRSRMYNVFFVGLLDVTLKNMRVTGKERYLPNEYERNRSLSQNLLPYIYEEDIEKHAEDFLKRYCQKALLQPMAIPVEEIAANLGMHIYYAPMEDGIFGKTYFDAEKVTVYDNIIKKNPHEIITKPGDMLINPDVFYMSNIGTANNTIIHECVHWDKHRRAFELQKLLQGHCTHISCEIVEEYEGIATDAPAMKWMEWQANQLAPRILMPEQMTRRVLDSLIQKEYQLSPRTRFAIHMENAIYKLSMYFGVSALAAKIRAIELGYDQAQGVQVYCDGKYLPPFSFRKGSLRADQTFVIDENNAAFNFIMNPVLRELFSEGKVIYANSMVCINMPKYITLNENDLPVLTDYALEHVDECCFIFNRSVNASKSYSDTYYRRCFLCRDINSETFIEADYDADNTSNQSKEKRREELSKVVDATEELSNVLESLPGSFSKTLEAHMKRKDINEEELSYRSNISTVTISKFINHNEAEKTFASVLAICIGLNLHPLFMEDLIAKAGYANRIDPTHIFVKFLIWNHSDDSIEGWQSKLDEAKINLKLPQKK